MDASTHHKRQYVIPCAEVGHEYAAVFWITGTYRAEPIGIPQLLATQR
jgi:hypothetical protein